MPSVGHDSSTSLSFGPGEYAPTEEAYTSVGTFASTAARKTRSLPATLTWCVIDSVRPGWISHARWTTASAPRSSGTRSEAAMSAAWKVVRANARSGARRATATISSTLGSASSDSSTLVPTFPVAPITTTRITHPYPIPPPRHRGRRFVSWPGVRPPGSISLGRR